MTRPKSDRVLAKEKINEAMQCFKCNGPLRNFLKRGATPKDPTLFRGLLWLFQDLEKQVCILQENIGSNIHHRGYKPLAIDLAVAFVERHNGIFTRAILRAAIKSGNIQHIVEDLLGNGVIKKIGHDRYIKKVFT